jgi:N-methylhydantoinase B
VTVSHRGERFASAPWGLHGGGPGRSGHAFVLRRDGRREELPSKQMVVLEAGDQLWEYIAGGAGHGDPIDRDPELVLADVLDGKVSRAAAREAYGVVLAAGGDALDELGTKECREALRRTRGPATAIFDRGVDGRQS